MQFQPPAGSGPVLQPRIASPHSRIGPERRVVPGHQHNAAVHHTAVYQVPLDPPVMAFVRGGQPPVVQERSLDGVHPAGPDSLRRHHRAGIDHDGPDKAAEADRAGGREPDRIEQPSQHSAGSRRGRVSARSPSGNPPKPDGATRRTVHPAVQRNDAGRGRNAPPREGSGGSEIGIDLQVVGIDAQFSGRNVERPQRKGVGGPDNRPDPGVQHQIADGSPSGNHPAVRDHLHRSAVPDNPAVDQVPLQLHHSPRKKAQVAAVL